ncbi:MAG: AAA family ATPase [Bryobacterales bacterium]|nr:AAA family ATPase [Bryobacterales bacterium]
MAIELTADKLRHKCDVGTLGCQSSAEISKLSSVIGQARAVRALKFGLGIREKGFNIFVAGLPGTGRTTAIERFLEEVAGGAPVPQDWCYVNNFKDSASPNVLRLPPGKAVELRNDMETLVNTAAQEIANAFESEEFPAQREASLKPFHLQKQALLEKINEEALQAGFMLQPSPMGVLTVPMRDGKPLTDEQFVALSKRAG